LSKNNKQQIWTVIHPEKGILIVCPSCRTVPHTYMQKHCSTCATELGWKGIYVIDTKRKEDKVDEHTKQEDHQENISEDK
jgi:hypothetical protein